MPPHVFPIVDSFYFLTYDDDDNDWGGILVLKSGKRKKKFAWMRIQTFFPLLLLKFFTNRQTNKLHIFFLTKTSEKKIITLNCFAPLARQQNWKLTFVCWLIFIMNSKAVQTNVFVHWTRIMPLRRKYNGKKMLVNEEQEREEGGVRGRTSSSSSFIFCIFSFHTHNNSLFLLHLMFFSPLFRANMCVL